MGWRICPQSHQKTVPSPNQVASRSRWMDTATTLPRGSDMTRDDVLMTCDQCHKVSPVLWSCNFCFWEVCSECSVSHAIDRTQSPRTRSVNDANANATANDSRS